MKLAKTVAQSWAHLRGISPRIRAEDDDEDERKQRADESDEDYAKRMEELDDKENKAEDDDPKKDDKKDAKADDSEDDDPEKDDDEDELKGKSKAASARRRERARCAAIFSCEAGKKRPDVAATLAFGTDMKRSEAIKVLTAVADGTEPRGSRFLSGMSQVRIPNPGQDSSGQVNQNDPKVIAAQVIAAAKKARGEV